MTGGADHLVKIWRVQSRQQLLQEQQQQQQQQGKAASELPSSDLPAHQSFTGHLGPVTGESARWQQGSAMYP